MPRQRFTVEFENAEGQLVIKLSGIPAQTKQEAIEKAKKHLEILTPTAIPNHREPTVVEVITAAINGVYGKMAQDAGDDEEPVAPPVRKATKRKGK